MIKLRALRSAAAVALLLFPFVAAAEEKSESVPAAPEEPVYDNHVTAGIGYQSADAFRFGRFNGLNGQGPFGIGEFLLRGGDSWDSGGTNHWRAEGRNLGLPSRSFDLQYGSQGQYGLQFYYDGVPFNQYKDLHTIYDNSGAEPALIVSKVDGDLTIYGRLIEELMAALEVSEPDLRTLMADAPGLRPKRKRRRRRRRRKAKAEVATPAPKPAHPGERRDPGGSKDQPRSSRRTRRKSEKKV